MIFGKNAKLMLKYQKAKAKLVEYNVPQSEYPRFMLNSNELSYPTTYVLSRYSECIIENNTEELIELAELLSSVAEYYDSALKSKDRQIYNLDFALSGASAYFLNNDFGSAKVLSQRANKLIGNVKCPKKFLLNVYAYLLEGKNLSYLKDDGTYENLNNNFLDYFEKGKSLQELKDGLMLYRKEVYECDDLDNVFYVDILVAVILIACNNSSWSILPRSSDIQIETWSSYLQSKLSVKMLWPAQRLMAEKGLLRGVSGVVQLPTGVGKTKSVEIIIRAAFLAERANTVIIVAPLRALCNEITMDMYRAFGRKVNINQFSDVLQNDFDKLVTEDVNKQIIICTPEKLSYVLHHTPDFLGYIDLFIFDEGHIFDEGGRGATYELLVTHIRQNKTDKQQLVLLSAVLPNSEEIKKWLFGDDGTLAVDKKIISTPKTIGFVSKKKDIHFFSDNKYEEDYYIPRILQTTKLNRLPRERKERIFPDLTVPIDIAIYNAIKLCPNGGVAIYIGQQRSMKTIFEKILDLNKRGYDLSSIKVNVKQEEMLKIKKFIECYYGDESYYGKVAEFGVVPHSSNLQNGIKIAIEYALKCKYVSCVVCTTTLAQGVNIPIKYLLVTSARVGSQLVKIRDFQNLVGRTARAGIYTEGSIIITDSKIYDDRYDRKRGGNYLWNEYIRLFDAKSSEPCSSSILSIVQSLKLDYGYQIEGKEFVENIINHIGEKDFFINYAVRLEKEYLEQFPNGKQKVIVREILLRYDILSNIENYLCLVYVTDMLFASGVKNAIDICSNTLAYSFASEAEKELLNKVFLKVEANVRKYSVEQLRRFSNSMSGIELSSQIEQWISDNELTERFYSEEELLDKIMEFYSSFNTFKFQDNFERICKMWIKGKVPIEIEQDVHIGIAEIDEICSKRISYELNFLIGNICDLINVDEDNETLVDPRKSLSMLQKKTKYGVSQLSAISICEKIFNDRLLATKISEIIADENVGTDKILEIVKNFKDDILKVLDDYPEYFKDRINLLLH